MLSKIYSLKEDLAVKLMSINKVPPSENNYDKLYL